MDKDLDQMTAVELRQYARNHGMSSITRLTRRDELIRAIKYYEHKKASRKMP